MALYQAIQRRSLALDLTNLVSFEVMHGWTDRLFGLYAQSPIPGFQKISQTQLLRADREAFVRLGELHSGPVKPGPGPGKRLDHLVGRLEHEGNTYARFLDVIRDILKRNTSDTGVLPKLYRRIQGRGPCSLRLMTLLQTHRWIRPGWGRLVFIALNFVAARVT